MGSIISAIADDEEDYLALCRELQVEPVERGYGKSFYDHWDMLKHGQARAAALQLMPAKERPTCEKLKVFSVSVGTGKKRMVAGFAECDGWESEETRLVYVAATSRAAAETSMSRFGVKHVDGEISDSKLIVEAWKAWPQPVIQRMHPEGPREVSYDYPDRFQLFQKHWLGKRLLKEAR